uniref:Uncharacterized protein n=1 Tax=Picea glauca TaxID=3330 RepID=A0A101M3Z2_PICGL|nr:hypothetical protein ABT39_MTgene376 [Picea glauca]QHR86490.1 hypothetical protein Q903MT_gene492 [Picea sitchensis]
MDLRGGITRLAAGIIAEPPCLETRLNADNRQVDPITNDHRIQACRTVSDKVLRYRPIPILLEPIAGRHRRTRYVK